MINLAIIGAGNMGASHARVAMGIRDARVALIVDVDRERGEKLAQSVGADYEPNIDEAASRTDAAVLAVPTELHRTIGVDLLRRGIDLLVEKPISASLADEPPRVL